MYYQYLNFRVPVGVCCFNPTAYQRSDAYGEVGDNVARIYLRHERAYPPVKLCQSSNSIQPFARSIHRNEATAEAMSEPYKIREPKPLQSFMVHRNVYSVVETRTWIHKSNHVFFSCLSRSVRING